MSILSQSGEFQSFKSSLARQRITVEDGVGEGVWTVYDTGPPSVRSPLIMLAPLPSTPEVYFKQVYFIVCKPPISLLISYN